MRLLYCREEVDGTALLRAHPSSPHRFVGSVVQFFRRTVLKTSSALLPKSLLPKVAGSNDSPGDSSYDTRLFLGLIESRCPSYGIVMSKSRGQMRLIVLALKGLVEEISNVYAEAENTGVGNILANKVRVPFLATIELQERCNFPYLIYDTVQYRGELSLPWI